MLVTTTVNGFFNQYCNFQRTKRPYLSVFVGSFSLVVYPRQMIDPKICTTLFSPVKREFKHEQL